MAVKGDSLGDRMKEYEARYAPRLMPLLPTLARLDGKAFHTFTRGLERPFDPGFVTMMRETTRYLVDESRAILGYTQSDEITLVFYTPDARTQLYFDGKIQKMISVLASMATAHFQHLLPDYLPSKADRNPIFDCRVWQVPTLCEAANAIVWRELDATRNSLQMVARSHYSHKQLHGKNTTALHDLIHEKGDNWDRYPREFKRGSYFGIRDTIEWPEVTPESPPAQKPIVRKSIMELDLEPILSYPDRVKTLFDVRSDCALTSAA